MIIQEIILPFDALLPSAKILRAGNISCMFENGNIRYIKVGEVEILSMVYGAIRDKNWASIPGKIQDENISGTEDGFTISYTAHYLLDEVDYEATFLIEGKATNSILFSMAGIANASFEANRIGLCVHHPIKECREKSVIITKPDGKFYRSVFPKFINPEPIFKEIKKMQWETQNNLTVRLLFDGAVFETEDQRNWSDSSYKTYSPLPGFPAIAQIIKGDKIMQTFTLKLSGITNHPLTHQNKIKKRKIPFPGLGYCRQKDQPKLTAREIALLTKIPFDHYRITLQTNERYWSYQLQMAIDEAELLHTKLQLVLYFGDDLMEGVNMLVYYLKDKQALVQSVLLLQNNQSVSSPMLLQQVYPVLKKQLPDIKIGYGAAFSFADLNRAKPFDVPCDFISFGFNPQVHAFDTRSFMESVQNQNDMMESLQHFAGGKEIHIGPVTLQGIEPKLFNTDDIKNDGQIDRVTNQPWLTAWWTLLTIQNCGAAKSISFFQLFGPQGLLQKSTSLNGEETKIDPSPLYEMLVAIKNFKPTTLIKRFYNDNLLLDGLMLENKKHERLLFKVPEEILNFKNGF